VTDKERIARLERAVGQVGTMLHRDMGTRLWRGRPDLLALVEELLGETFDPAGVGTGIGASP
jgi:hypothetical protein